MLVPNSKMAEALAVAKAVAEATTVGDPNGNAQMGPVISATQWDKIQTLIQTGHRRRRDPGRRRPGQARGAGDRLLRQAHRASPT